MPHLPTEAASDVCSTAHERVATKQTARQAAARTGFDAHWTIRAPAALLLALRICTSYSTRLAPCIRGHLVRNAAHEGFCISLLERSQTAETHLELAHAPAGKEQERREGERPPAHADAG